MPTKSSDPFMQFDSSDEKNYSRLPTPSLSLTLSSMPHTLRKPQIHEPVGIADIGSYLITSKTIPTLEQDRKRRHLAAPQYFDPKLELLIEDSVNLLTSLLYVNATIDKKSFKKL